MIFVDSGAWFAGIVADDVDHQAASEWFELNTERLFVTDYIIDETLTYNNPPTMFSDPHDNRGDK